MTNKLKKNGERENLIVITTQKAQTALQAYQDRWSIEVFFQSIKKRGFNLEQTHLKVPKRLKKLFAMVCLAFVVCLKVGIWKDKNRKAIKIKTLNLDKPNIKNDITAALKEKHRLQRLFNKL